MSLASQISAHLPYLRRYARALTGAQASGDRLVAATLEAIIADTAIFPSDVAPRLALYRVFQKVWAAAATVPEQDAAMAAGALVEGGAAADMAGARLAAITPLSRQALLLGAMEGFSTDDIAFLIDRLPGQVPALVDEALAEISRQTATRVMIIEDEPIIALDIEAIVRDLGHAVTGIATTHDEAMTLFHADAPGLVLADIQLADASSGIEAVRHILAEQLVPVIFITAFPERLLTGERPEPTFLITKPFQDATVQAAIAQALFFNSTAPLHG
jgi:CheY-like chemotaxis protein